MKTTVEYRSGLMLIMPEEARAAMLLLEWVSGKRNKVSIIHQVIRNEEGKIKVRMNCLREDYLSCAEYINNNI